MGLFRGMDDAALLYLLGFLPAGSLATLGACCRALYVFSHHGDLWRALAVRDGGEALGRALGGEGDLQGAAAWWSWKAAVLRSGPRAAAAGGAHLPVHRPLAMPGVYSDLLFKHHACAASQLPSAWREPCTLPREGLATLPPTRFFAQYEALPGRPCVLQGAASAWAALGKWTPEYLARTAGSGARFHCGGVALPLASYLAYSAAVSGREDRPLYLFERAFTALAPPLASDFCTPPHFADDLTALLPPGLRPDCGWIIAGPRKSGSTFHKDPNASSAWNALVYGLKAWILYPPQATPPGVIVSTDSTEVATPVSVMEWYLDHFPAHKRRAAAGGADAPLCGLQRPGDVVFIPAGWWHQVLNLEDSLALTHNFISPRNVGPALELFRDDPAAVSLPTPAAQEGLYGALREALRLHRPEVLAAVEGRGGQDSQPATAAAATAAAAEASGRQTACGAEAAGAAPRWAALTEGREKAFVFAFGSNS